MRIGFLVNTCEPFYRGGYERRTWNFARELARQGHEVFLYTSSPREEIREGVVIKPLAPLRPFFDCKGSRHGWADLLFALAIIPCFWRWRRKELDILDVCATPFIHLPLAAILCWWKTIPVVLTCHEALESSLPAYVAQRAGRKTNKIFQAALIVLVRGLYHLGTGSISFRLAVSPSTAKGLAREKWPVAAVVEFGLPPEAYRPGPEFVKEKTSEVVRLIFCGRLIPEKNVATTLLALAEVFSLFDQPGVPIHFHLLGEGASRSTLQELAVDLGITDQVTFHGEVSEEKKRELLGSSDIFILSSLREGFSVATLEAMAQGVTPLVCHQPEVWQGALDYVRHEQEGWVCQLQSVSSLAQSLHYLVRHEAQRRALGQAAFKKSLEYRLTLKTERLVEVYTQAIRQNT